MTILFRMSVSGCVESALVGSVLAVAAGVLPTGIACAQICPAVIAPVRVNDSYAPDANGNWLLIENFRDLNSDGHLTKDDYYNFHDVDGRPVNLPDPTIIRITSTYGTWYYITGTSDSFHTGNFPIYRTQDFTHFYLHMLAFDDFNQNGSNQFRAGGTISLNGHLYFSLWAPQMYRDPSLSYPIIPIIGSDPTDPTNPTNPTGDPIGGQEGSADATGNTAPNDGWMLASGQLTESQFDQQVAATNGDPWIFLNFAAVEVPGSTAVTANDTHHSCFHVRIRQSKFLEWHTRHPVADDGTRFADHRNSGPGYVAWFGYVLNNNPPTGSNYLYDGGWAQGGSAYPPTRFIPAGGSLDLLGPACGQLEQRCVGLSHRCVGAATWMNIDPFVFVDPQLANDGLWKRAMVYNWDDRNGGVNATLFSQWGNHVTAAPLRAYEFVFDTRADVIPMATNRNSTAANLLHGPLLDPRPPEGQCPDPYNTYGAAGDFDNGASNNLAKEWNAGAVAEGVCAFYHPGFNRYYLLYSRNPFGSPAYQIVYRMTAAGQPFTSIQLPSFTATNQPENLLLRSDDFQVGGNQNYGHCEVFTIADSTGTDHYYLMFHAKWKDVAGVPLMRTIFFKELTFTTDGTIRQLAENGTPDVDIHKFRIPYCRP